MSFEEFETLARLYIVGALDDEETQAFQQARKKYGARAERTINECRKLNAAFALSLHPLSPHPQTKEKLLARIHDAMFENPTTEIGGMSESGNGRAGGI